MSKAPRKWLVLLALFMLVVPFLLEGQKTHGFEKPIVMALETEKDFGLLKEKTYLFSNDDIYWIKRIEAKKNSSPYKLTLYIPGRNGVFRYTDYQDSKKDKIVWKIVKLDEIETLPLSTGFIETSGKNLWIGMPNVYSQLGKGTMEEKYNLSKEIKVAKDEKGYNLEVTLPVYQGLISEVWALESDAQLVPWNYKKMSDVWLALDLTSKGKWSYDGYYIKTPESYLPHTAYSFWRIPENYILKSLLYTGESRAADDMGYVMLDTALQNQNKQGYWDTLPLSTWLQKDYLIQDGFFDTRFNIGAADLFLEGCRKYGERKFCGATQRFMNYFKSHAVKNKYIVRGSRDGWLVPDYAHPNGNKPTHVSLNHQLAEINYLYKMYNHFKDPSYKELAENLLYGVTNLGSRWIAKNGDLHYAYFGNGEFGRTDYPYLTYNDLLETQKWHRIIYGSDNNEINILINNKEKWMQNNNVRNPFRQ
ncbi:hypothetical protein BAG01nite_44490 [Brevibacillus agri]|uniref:D-glucuronyl C5-epimerase C-terminal domain-containing protein n=1 Tax=Brevibacillus agri TaxID=51101 RepID=A0A3M8A660_9BACL|nr:hypothetical protein [Brevibacillus agri]MED1642633.1 hypothetical protein [Brevibacillus agri]MED1653191.1 hypothetical protein [Brevibacillus agri]MED1686876.1 hypothetical protein [Brevibacillus agri]MED1692133.1 hypothetical protein [Brevibacillus agri]MED1698345.1 hypothetical protein [Brevibacillus agri]